jgi:hypothetical protein
MRGALVGLGFAVGLPALGCTSILGDFNMGPGAGNASLRDSTPDVSSETGGNDASDSGRRDAASDSSPGDAPAEMGCAHTLCGTPPICVDTRTDPKNCGSCGHSCLGGSCSAGACGPVTMVSPTSGLAMNVVDVDTDGTVVVWADFADSSIDQVSTPGGTKLVLVAPTEAPSVGLVAVGGTGGLVAYAADFPITVSTAELDVANSGATLWSDGAETTSFPAGLVWDPAGDTAYVLGVLNATAGPYDILSCLPAGTCTGDYMVSTANPNVGHEVGVATNWVAWGDIGAETLDIYSTSMGTTMTVPGQLDAYYVTSDSVNVYWAAATGSTETIFAANGTSATVTTVLAGITDGVIDIATDGTNVYVVTSSGLYYVPVTGAASATALDTSQMWNGVKYRNGALVYWTMTGIYLHATP